MTMTLTDGGWCDIFLEKDKKQQSRSWLRNCLQDAVLNACIQLNVPLKKEVLYEEVPPQLTVNLDMYTLMHTPCVERIVTFKRSNIDRLKGGIAFNLLQIKDNGVYICLCTVNDFINGEWHEESHAFVYNSHYRATENNNCIGAVIDNRSNAPVRLIDEEDRRDISKSRQLFDNFFNANTKIQHVYLIEKKISH